MGLAAVLRGCIVRFYLPAVAVSLCIMPMSVMLAGSPAPAKPAAPVATPASSSAAANADAFAAHAAARHAKRTECLKEARTKKLVGANKDAYVKDCVGP